MENDKISDYTTSVSESGRTDDFSQWQQASAMEDEVLDGRNFEIYSAAENGDHDFESRSADEESDEKSSEDSDEGTQEWGDVDPQPSGNGGMDPSGPGSAV